MWVAQGFEVKTSSGSHEIAGWVNGVMALDFRVYRDVFEGYFDPGWNLTHLPTGYTICGIISSLEEAKATASVLAEEVDWNFTDPTAGADRAIKFSAVKDRIPSITRRKPALEPIMEGVS